MVGMIKLLKPNPMFKLVKVDDYNKKIFIIKMPLYYKTEKKFKKSNYEVNFDLYPTQTNCYMLCLSKLANITTGSILNIILDKDCVNCNNRISGCELNLISKILLCCNCNLELMSKSLNNFLDLKSHTLSIKKDDFPSYIKDNFHNISYLEMY
jgi:hypothetical protein